MESKVVCENCGHVLSKEYVRVMLPDKYKSEDGKIPFCPNCDRLDKVHGEAGFKNYHIYMDE